MTVIAAESFIETYNELLPLFELHWKELGPYKDKMPLSPHIELYNFLESQGQLLTLIARQNGKIVGYIICAIRYGLHYSTTLQAITDIPYVAPSVRGHGIGVRLFLAAQEELKARKVGPWFASYKVGSALAPSMDKVLRWLGMQPCDLQFSKWLD
jgi:ribosomal protein S18 acetylase RimI-like enzyme